MYAPDDCYPSNVREWWGNSAYVGVWDVSITYTLADYADMPTKTLALFEFLLDEACVLDIEFETLTEAEGFDYSHEFTVGDSDPITIPVLGLPTFTYSSYTDTDHGCGETQ